MVSSYPAISKIDISFKISDLTDEKAKRHDKPYKNNLNSS